MILPGSSVLARVAVLVLLVSACSNTSGPQRALENDPDLQLASVLARIDEVESLGTRCYETGSGPTTDCERLLSALEMLSVRHPRHVPILLANARMAHETGQPKKALSYLSRVAEQDPANPEAAVLRGRIAIEEGNLPFARRYLAEQAEIRPDHAEIQETLAAAYYLSGDLENARRSLEAARRRGAPDWRVEYHLGLVAEGLGNHDEAAAHYRNALREKPEFEAAQSRLLGLELSSP